MGTGFHPQATYFSHARKVGKSALRCPLRRALAPAGGHSPYLLPPKSPKLRAPSTGQCSSNLGTPNAAAVALAKQKVS